MDRDTKMITRFLKDIKQVLSHWSNQFSKTAEEEKDWNSTTVPSIQHFTSFFFKVPFILKFLWCVCVTFSVFKHSNSASTGQVMAKHDKNIDFLRLGASHPKWLLFWWTLEDNGCQRDLVFDRINPHMCPITTTCHTVNPTCSLRVSCPGDLHHI